MPERLPELLSSLLDTSNQSVVNHRNARERTRSEFELYRYQLRSAVEREKDLIDTDTLAEVFAAATDSELAFLREFRGKANGSAAAMEIVAHKLQMLDDITNRRINRRFGR
jgi:hypothetical protein